MGKSKKYIQKRRIKGDTAEVLKRGAGPFGSPRPGSAEVNQDLIL